MAAIFPHDHSGENECFGQMKHKGLFCAQTACVEYLLFIAYLVLFAWLVTRVRFFTRSGLTAPQLVILFLLKVMAGIFYGWIGIYYGGLAQMVDTWSYHTASMAEYRLLWTDPAEYFTNLFRNPYDSGVSDFLSVKDSFWNDLKANFFIKVLSVFNVFSFGHYYVNVILYAFISLFGPIALYRVMSDIYPGKKVPVLLATFLVPSFLYWTSGLHKEGLLFTGIALVVYSVYFTSKEKRMSILRALSLLLGLGLILILRNFILVIIVPALLAWVVAMRWPKKGLPIFAGLYVLFLLVFFTARRLDPRLDFPQAVVTRQQEFVKLIGSSSVPIRELQPTVSSFLKNTPQAIDLSILRPLPRDVRHILSLAAALEVQLLLLMFVIFLLLKTGAPADRNFIYFSLFFSGTLLLAIGFSVNNLGAIVRYRSVIIPFLVVPMVAQINWSRVGQFFLGNIKNKNNINTSA